MDSDPEALGQSAEQLLRAWFHWWRTSQDAPDHLPEGLHIATAAYLTARAVMDGRKVYGPQSL